MNALIIATTAIRQDEEGRFSLNDLHRAAGGERRVARSTRRVRLGQEELRVLSLLFVDASQRAARVVELVNVHEKLREQVAESLRELDDLLAQLED